MKNIMILLLSLSTLLLSGCDSGKSDSFNGFKLTEPEEGFIFIEDAVLSDDYSRISLSYKNDLFEYGQGVFVTAFFITKDGYTYSEAFPLLYVYDKYGEISWRYSSYYNTITGGSGTEDAVYLHNDWQSIGEANLVVQSEYYDPFLEADVVQHNTFSVVFE